MKKTEKLMGLLGVFKEIKSEADNYSAKLDQTIYDASTSGFGIVFRSFHQYMGIKIHHLIEYYNASVANLNEFADTDVIGVNPVDRDNEIGDTEEAKGESQVANALITIKVGSNGAIKYIEGLNLDIPIKEKDALDSLLMEIKPLERFNQPLYAHMVDSIEAYEKGKHIAASVTAAKVIVYCLEHIPGKNDDERVAHLVSKKLLDKRSEEKYITAVRNARNVFSHEINYLPRPQDALSIITDSVKMAMLLPKLENTT